MPQELTTPKVSEEVKSVSTVGGTDDPSTSSELRPDVAMHRAINNVEKSDKYKNATPKQKISMQKWLFQSYVLPARGVSDAANVNLKDYIKGRFTRNTEKDTFLADNTSTSDKKIKAVQHGVNTMAEAVYAMYQKGNDLFNNTVAKDIETYKGGFNTGGLKGVFPSDKPIHNEVIEKYFKDDKNWMESRYKSSNPWDNAANKIIKESGTFIGQGPAFSLAAGITEGIGLRAILNDGVGMLSGRGGLIARASSAILDKAAEGYLVGVATHDHPLDTAIGFGILGPVLDKFVGKLIGVGGVKFVSQSIDHAQSLITKNGVEATSPSALISMVGTKNQKIGAGMLKMLNELAGGDFGAASQSVKDESIKKLAKAVPELTDKLAALNPTLFEMHVANQTAKWRASVPQANELLSKLEQVSSSSTSQAVTERVNDLTKAENIRSDPKAYAQSIREEVVPGAASKDSLEFETNFSRNVDVELGKLGIGKDKIVFEDRGHKELFYLNALLAQAKQKGKLGKAADKQFNFLLRHLQDRYKDAPLSDLIKMSDAVWSKIEMLSKAGYVKEGQPVRIFRQSEFRPGESPFGHEVDLIRESAKADEKMNSGSINQGKATLAPEGKERRGSPRVNLNDPDSIREIIDMHTMRANMLSKDLSKKGITSAERSELQEAIEIENRKKVEQKNRLAEITQEELERKKGNGPGAASASDPSFVGKVYGKHADLINQTNITGLDLELHHKGRTDVPKNDINKILELYKTDPHFKTIADASRHYVHNNEALVDGSRVAIGKEPLNVYQAKAGKYWASKTTMIDGSVWENPDHSMTKVEGFSVPNIIKTEDAIKMVEHLFTAIRETKPIDIPLYRGMSFGSGEMSVKNYNQFRDLKPGDVVDLPLSSFSHKKITADIFSTTNGDSANSVVLKIEGPHKSLNMQPFNRMPEGEYVTNGAFEVVSSDYSIRPGGKILRITIKQKGTF